MFNSKKIKELESNIRELKSDIYGETENFLGTNFNLKEGIFERLNDVEQKLDLLLGYFNLEVKITKDKIIPGTVELVKRK